MIVSNDKARSIKMWRREFGVEELDWPSHSSDLSHTEHFRDELKTERTES